LPSKDSKTSETFLRYAFINILFEIILASKDTNILIEGMTLLGTESLPMAEEQIAYLKEKIYDEVLSLMTSGKFSLEQVKSSFFALFWLASGRN